MQYDDNVSGFDKFAYSVVGAADAASFGIVRNWAKTPTLITQFVWPDATDMYTSWVDHTINAGTVSDKLFEGGVWLYERWKYR